MNDGVLRMSASKKPSHFERVYFKLRGCHYRHKLDGTLL